MYLTLLHLLKIVAVDKAFQIVTFFDFMGYQPFVKLQQKVHILILCRDEYFSFEELNFF